MNTDISCTTFRLMSLQGNGGHVTVGADSCAIINEAFTCGPNIFPTLFSYDKTRFGLILGVDGASVWNFVPSGDENSGPGLFGSGENNVQLFMGVTKN